MFVVVAGGEDEGDGGGRMTVRKTKLGVVDDERVQGAFFTAFTVTPYPHFDNLVLIRPRDSLRNTTALRLANNVSTTGFKL